MPQTTSHAAAPAAVRTVTVADHGALDIHALVLLAVLLAAGFILNFTLGKTIGGMTGGAINPEFIISAFCLTILIVRPGVGQSLIIGLISAAVIQITTSSPFIDFAAEGVAAMAMALIVRAGMRTPARVVVPAAGTFVTTALSGAIFMVIKMAIMGFAQNLAVIMLPIVLVSAIFNAVLVAALYPPVKAALELND